MTDTQRSAAPDYQLADRYRREEGRVFLSGLQAIARLPVDQLRIDRRNGLTTAAFISGYQGSPVRDVPARRSTVAITTVPDLPIVNQPGASTRELAATSVMGSQLTGQLRRLQVRRRDGHLVRQRPGIDRAGDADPARRVRRHRTPRRRRRLVGDDPAAKSSTLPSSSDATMVDLHMPLLFPGDSQEALDLGRHAIALSRACGLWAGLKLTSPIADGTGTVDVSVDRVVPHIPTAIFDGKPFRPHPNGRLIAPYSVDMEREFHEVRTDLARQYGASTAEPSRCAPATAGSVSPPA